MPRRIFHQSGRFQLHGANMEFKKTKIPGLFIIKNEALFEKKGANMGHLPHIWAPHQKGAKWEPCRGDFIMVAYIPLCCIHYHICLVNYSPALAKYHCLRFYGTPDKKYCFKTNPHLRGFILKSLQGSMLFLFVFEIKFFSHFFNFQFKVA